jgi:F-type H+-transporting ATPase subunit delta
MSEGVVARRYASALFKFSLDQKVLSRVAEDMSLVADTIKGSKPLQAALKNPIVPLSARRAVLNDLFKKRVSKLTGGFFDFLEKKNRLEILGRAAGIFSDLEKNYRGIVEAKLISAKPVSKKVMENLAQGLNKRLGKTVIIEKGEDESLIGGFKLLIKDRIYDCSIKSALERLKGQLAGSAF